MVLGEEHLAEHGPDVRPERSIEVLRPSSPSPLDVHVLALVSAVMQVQQEVRLQAETEAGG